MINGERTKSRLEKADYLILGAIIVFGIMTCFIMEEILFMISSDSIGLDLHVFLLYLCPIPFIFIALFSIYKGKSTPEDWGLSLGRKTHWYPFLFLFLFAMWFTPELSMNIVVKTIPLTLVFTASVLFLQARLMTFLKSLMGSSLSMRILIVLATGLIYFLSFSTVIPFSLLPIILIIIFAATILESKSILLAIPMMGIIVLNKTDTFEGVHFALCVLSFIVYYALAIGARLLNKTNVS